MLSCFAGSVVSHSRPAMGRLFFLKELPMLALNNDREDRPIQWQTCFLAMLPEIQHRLHLAFCHLSQEAREDSIEEGTVHCLLTYIRLFERGRAGSVSPSSLSWYAALAVKRGRPASCRMNSKDPLSRYA